MRLAFANFVKTISCRARELALGCAGMIACGPNLTDVARTRGASDLACPYDVVSAYAASGGAFVARGCERWIEYACFYSRLGDPVCIRQSGARETPDTN